MLYYLQCQRCRAAVGGIIEVWRVGREAGGGGVEAVRVVEVVNTDTKVLPSCRAEASISLTSGLVFALSPRNTVDAGGGGVVVYRL